MADIIISYCEPIDTALVTSKQHFIDYLVKQGHRILYLESPPSILRLIRHFRFYKNRKLKNFLKLVEVKKNIWTYCGFAPLPYHRGIFDRLLFNKVNQFFAAFFLKRILKKLQFNQPHFILYCPNIVPVLDKFNPSRTLLHIIDDWDGMPEFPTTMDKLVLEAARKSDVVIVSASVLLNKYEKIAQNRINLLHHGVHLNMFLPVYEKLRRANKLIDVNKKITLGYYGALHKLDYDLIKSIATKKAGWEFIFCGPVSGLQGVSSESFKNLPNNITIRNEIPYQNLPQFLTEIDLFWMPFIINQATHAMCPIKIFEVAAAGLPAVMSDLEEPKKIGAPFFYDCARTSEEHILAIENALLEETSARKEARHAAITLHDWKDIAPKFECYLLGL